MGDILLMLLGGVHKVTPEDIQLRGDINVCVVGGMGGVNGSDSPTPNCVNPLLPLQGFNAGGVSCGVHHYAMYRVLL